jgi:hypothetical protein
MKPQTSNLKPETPTFASRKSAFKNRTVKKILVAILLLTTFIACKQRVGKAEGEKSYIVLNDSASLTTIEWIDSPHHDIGSLKEGEEVEILFRFKNTGDKPLVIESVIPGCGCTGAEKPEEPIMPGKEGEIKAKFSSRGFQGTQTKYVNVNANTKKSNTGSPSNHSLSFTVNVEKQ